MTITIWRWHLIIPWRWQLRFRFAIKTLNTCRVRIANNMHLGWHWQLLWRWHLLIPWRWQLHFPFVLQTLNTCMVRNANNKRSQSSWSRPYHRERCAGIVDNGSGDTMMMLVRMEMRLMMVFTMLMSKTCKWTQAQTHPEMHSRPNSTLKLAITVFWFKGFFDISYSMRKEINCFKCCHL